MDLSKQKTFITHQVYPDYYYDAFFNFCLQKLENKVWILSHFCEFHGGKKFIAVIEYLEDLEYYYNNSTLYQSFQWA